MKKISSMILGMLIVSQVFSRDFQYSYKGQTLTYTVISEEAKTCMVKEQDGPSDYLIYGDLEIPEIAVDYGKIEYSVTKIGRCAFNFCDGLASVIIPNTVTEIDSWAFGSNSNLASVSIGNSVKVIGYRAFADCGGLTSITIPDSVETIDNSAFEFCSGLASVSIGNSVNTIGSDAFHGCDALTKVDYSSIESLCSMNQIYKPRAPYLYINGKEVTHLDIPETVSSIVERVFSGFIGLTSVTIPSSVESIGKYAFSGCSGLTSVTIPNSVESIGKYAFSGCSGLTSVTLPASIESIGDGWFSGCGNLTSLTIGNSVKRIESGAFSDSGITSLKIPDSVEKIEDFAFCSCGLTSITIPNSVMEIGSNAFSMCSDLTYVYYESVNPISGDENIFFGCYDKAYLFVPGEAIEACKKTEPWKYFSNIVEYDPSGIEEIFVDIDINLPYEIYSLNGIKVRNSIGKLSAGVYILRQGINTKKIIVK